MRIITTTLTAIFAACAAQQTVAFLAPTSAVARSQPLQLAPTNGDCDDVATIGAKRRDFLLQSLGAATVALTSTAARADDDYLYKRGEGGDLTSQLFNPDGSLKDPNTVVEAQEKALSLSFNVPSATDGVIINVVTDGAQGAPDAANNLKASYKLPLKWNLDASSSLPLYYDSSEGKNGKSCNRVTVYSVSAPSKLDMSTLEKASKVGVAKSLFMDAIPNGYFDQGVLKADLISGRTVRKPIKSFEVDEGIDEQVYYEFDLAFAPLQCPDFMEGNRENLGLGFCPYDNIFLVSATVLKRSEKDEGGTLMCCVVECNKDEWKIANSDLKRVRSSFVVERA